MNVLIYTPFYYPSVGGVETFTDALATGLARRGVNVHLVAATALGDRTELPRPFPIERSEAAGGVVARLNKSLDAVVSVGPSVRPLGAAHRRGIATVLVHQGPAGRCPVSIAWRHERQCSAGLPRCLSCDVCGQKWTDNLRYLARFVLLRWGIHRASANVFISDYMRRRVGGPRAQVIANPFDPEVYRPAALVPLANKPRFTFVGRLVPLKGAELAVRAFALATARGLDARLLVVGEGPSAEPCRRLVEELGLGGRVEFRPFQGAAKLAEVYRNSWGLLFPSQWEEPFGIVVAEAMACGCPVVASAHGAPPELVGDTGLLVPPADVGAWAERMLELANNPERRHDLAKRAALRAREQFALPAMLDRYQALLESVARRRPGRALEVA
jgi:glycosyltransferase involved in cell wall biosynthesis